MPNTNNTEFLVQAYQDTQQDIKNAYTLRGKATTAVEHKRLNAIIRDKQSRLSRLTPLYNEYKAGTFNPDANVESAVRLSLAYDTDKSYSEAYRSASRNFTNNPTVMAERRDIVQTDREERAYLRDAAGLTNREISQLNPQAKAKLLSTARTTGLSRTTTAPRASETSSISLDARGTSYIQQRMSTAREWEAQGFDTAGSALRQLKSQTTRPAASPLPLTGSILENVAGIRPGYERSVIRTEPTLNKRGQISVSSRLTVPTITQARLLGMSGPGTLQSGGAVQLPNLREQRYLRAADLFKRSDRFYSGKLGVVGRGLTTAGDFLVNKAASDQARLAQAPGVIRYGPVGWSRTAFNYGAGALGDAVKNVAARPLSAGVQFGAGVVLGGVGGKAASWAGSKALVPRVVGKGTQKVMSGAGYLGGALYGGTQAVKLTTATNFKERSKVLGNTIFDLGTLGSGALTGARAFSPRIAAIPGARATAQESGFKIKLPKGQRKLSTNLKRPNAPNPPGNRIVVGERGKYGAVYDAATGEELFSVRTIPRTKLKGMNRRGQLQILKPPRTITRTTPRAATTPRYRGLASMVGTSTLATTGLATGTIAGLKSLRLPSTSTNTLTITRFQESPVIAQKRRSKALLLPRLATTPITATKPQTALESLQTTGSALGFKSLAIPALATTAISSGFLTGLEGGKLLQPPKPPTAQFGAPGSRGYLFPGFDTRTSRTPLYKPSAAVLFGGVKGAKLKGQALTGFEFRG